MLTNKDYCDYDTSIALSELGFPLKRMKVKNFIDGQFSDSIVTVLLYEAQKWLREEKGLFIEISIFLGKYDLDICNTKIEYDKTHKILCEICGFESYEEALSEGIKEAVKILKDGIGK